MESPEDILKPLCGLSVIMLAAGAPGITGNDFSITLQASVILI